MQLLHHEFHRAVDIHKEHPVTFAQIIQAWLAFRSFSKPVFWTFAPACKKDRAFFTVFREIIPFITSKLSLPFSVNQLRYRNFQNIT